MPQSALASSLQNRPRLCHAIALACVVFVYFSGVIALKAGPISFDEIETLKHTITRWTEYTYNIPETINSVATRSVEHGPLYFVLLNIWQRLAGYDLFASRLLSVLIASLVASSLYRLAGMTGKREVACAAVVAIACLAWFNYYAQVTRYYALLLLMVTWLLWSYWRVITAGGAASSWRWLSLFAAAALIVYVNYFGFIVIAAVGAYHLLFARKDQRWLAVSLLMAAACSLFAFWLPVALRGFERSGDTLDPSRLPLTESLPAILSICANGIWLLPLVAAGALLWRGRRNHAETYLCVLALAILLLLYAMNEFTTIMVARRMRYTITLTVPFCCFLAIGLARLPQWGWLRFALLALWLAAGYGYFRSEDFLVYTNRRAIDHDQVPHYQVLLHHADKLPGAGLPVLSAHENALVNDYEILTYYRARLPQFADVAHVGYSLAGRLTFQSKTLPFRSPDSLVANANGLWLLHNPRLTELDALDYHRDWFSQHYRSCGDFVEQPQAAISLWLKPEIPCQLIASDSLLSARYDNGTRLGNAIVERLDDSLAAYLWWHEPGERKTSYSLQLFDAAGERQGQVDAVIVDDPIDISRMDIGGLAAGAYTLKLIVYDFETLESHAGDLADGSRFTREVVIHSFVLN